MAMDTPPTGNEKFFPYSQGSSDTSAREYEIISSIDDDKARQVVQTLLSSNLPLSSVLKDHRKRFISTVHLEDKACILKIPLGRNTRLWERFLTLFRASDAYRCYFSMIRLKAMGLHCPTPILAAQRRRLGMVVDSFFIYEYQNGEPAGSSDLPLIRTEMAKLHEAGYIRSDPKPANFIKNHGRIYFIDFRLKKPLLFRTLRIAMNSYLPSGPDTTHEFSVPEPGYHPAFTRTAHVLVKSMKTVRAWRKQLVRLIGTLWISAHYITGTTIQPFFSHPLVQGALMADGV